MDYIYSFLGLETYDRINAAIIIQNVYCSHLQKQKYQLMKNSAKKIQKLWKLKNPKTNLEFIIKYKYFKNLVDSYKQDLILKNKAANMIQKYYIERYYQKVWKPRRAKYQTYQAY